MTKVTDDGSKTYMWEQKNRILSFRVFLTPKKHFFIQMRKGKALNLKVYACLS